MTMSNRRWLAFAVLFLAGCGFVPSESKLVGTWQADLPMRQALVYRFETNHTYTMSFGDKSGEMQGTWKLDGNRLTITVKSFGAKGTIMPLPGVKGLSSQENIIVRLTDSRMTWRSGIIGSDLKLKRVKL